MRERKLVVGVFLVLSLGLSACSTTPSTRSSAPDMSKASPQEAEEFHAIDRAYRLREYDSVLKRTKTFVSKRPQSSLLDQVHNFRGLAYLALKQYQYALINFKQVLSSTGNEVLHSMALYNKAYAENELGKPEEARASLESIRINVLPNFDRAKVFVLSAKIHRQSGDHLGAAGALLSAIKYSDPQATTESSSLIEVLGDSLNHIESRAAIEKLRNDHEDSRALDLVYYRVAELSLSNGDRDAARSYAERILNQFPQSRHASFARDLLNRPTVSSRADTTKVGVLLTLSGKFGRFGYKTLQGIQLALNVFQPSAAKGRPVTVIIMDDKGEPESAVKAFDELVQKHEVVAVIGPLLSKLADPLANRAQDVGVPLITLTQKEAPGEGYVFNAALTPAMQIRELLRVAQEVRGVKNYAILAPASKFGEEYAKSFWDEAVKLESTIAGFETYPAAETDFRSYIDNLVGLAHPDARGPELEELRLLKANAPVKMSNKRMNAMFSLKPFVDFEAVFIPEEPKTLGQILPTFAYRDVEKMLFLGINTWNSPDLPSRAGQYAEGSIFVDAFFPGSQLPSARRFIDDFRATFNTEPTSLEAISYDAANIVASILRNDDISSRNDLRDRITGLRNFPGIMGGISYKTGKLTKQLAVLTVRDGAIQEFSKDESEKTAE